VIKRERPLPARLTEADIAAHAALVSKIGAKAIWTKYDG
jgi:DNA polymerase III subunit epsilon